jgi:broad specificity phosphatase PhoE
MELYLVRHGQTEWSRDGKHTGLTDIPLTDKGEEQARQLLGHLDPASFGLILSSPRQRATRTAELAGFTGAYAPEITEDLVEWDYGDYEGRTSREIQETVPGWTIWTHPAPEGEAADHVTERLRRVIDRVLSSEVERAICFGHGHALRALAVCWLGLDISHGLQFELDTGTVSVLSLPKGVRGLQRWNAPV